MSFQEIGGFIELELPSGYEYHHEALRFNSGRNALCFYLLEMNITELYVPLYISENITEALIKEKIDIHFYNIDEDFNPMLSSKDVGEIHILLVNYFGICESIIKENVKKFKNIIIDSTHSFFTNPENDVPIYYSPRQFFGVADGGYLYAKGLTNADIGHGESAQRYMARLSRIENGAKASNYIYRNTEQLIGWDKIKKMSVLTQKVLSSIRYDMVWERRESNFKYLHSKLKNDNKLKIITNSVHGPMVYPFLTEEENLRKYLIQNGVFAEQYWPEVLKRDNINSFESEISTKMCALPIDQRYSVQEMEIIVDLINTYMQRKNGYSVKNTLKDAETFR